MTDHDGLSLTVCLFTLLQHNDIVQFAIEESIVFLFHHVPVLPLQTLLKGKLLLFVIRLKVRRLLVGSLGEVLKHF
jgi:hypothetical protein